MAMRAVLRIVLAALSVVLPAATSQAQGTVTLAQALDQTMAQNRTLRAAYLGVEEQAARVDEVRAGWFPRVVVSELWQRGDQPVFVFSSLLAARHFAAANLALD